MSRHWFVALVLAASLAGATGSQAQIFGPGEFPKYLSKFGTVQDFDRAKRMCICKEAGDLLNAAGHLSFLYDSSDNLYRTWCHVPRPPGAASQVSVGTLCDSFALVQ